MPRRRPNPKKAKGAKRRGDKSQPVTPETIERWEEFLGGMETFSELAQSCPELSGDALNERYIVEESGCCRLDLSGCSMTALPPSISTLNNTTLVALNLGECTELTALPEEIGELSALMSLDVSECSSLAALPAAIGKLKSLYTLNLSRCLSLVALPDAIGEIRTLNYLTLAGCLRLASLPDAIGDLEALQILDLTRCSVLQRIPSTIGELKVLKALSLANCMSLSALPDRLNELGALKTLILGGCSSLALRLGALAGLGALKALIVAGCDSIEALNIDGLPNLTVLDVSSGCNNLRITSRAILALREQRVEVKGFSMREMMRNLRNKAKRRRQRRLCDFCGWQGSIAEPRLPVCYCGRRRYCDENCQLADWGAGHSKTCSMGSLSIFHIVSLQGLENLRSKGLLTDADYRARRGEIMSITPAEARSLCEKARQQGIFPDTKF